MNRLLVFALVASLGNVSAAFAGESILTAGTRHVQQLAATETVAASVTATTPVAAPVAVGQNQKKKTAAYQEQGGNLSRHGMSKGKKALIFIALGVGFAAGAYAIDQNVLDITPSSLGTRQD